MSDYIYNVSKAMPRKQTDDAPNVMQLFHQAYAKKQTDTFQPHYSQRPGPEATFEQIHGVVISRSKKKGRPDCKQSVANRAHIDESMIGMNAMIWLMQHAAWTLERLSNRLNDIGLTINNNAIIVKR
jgi:hypothetical protein